MTYVYDKSGQSLFFVREASYGLPYDPEGDAGVAAWTIVPDDYPHWRRFDKIPDGIDMVPPLIEKLKQFDIGDAKHASAILEGNIEPVEFSIPMTAQGLEFLALAVGKPSLTSHDRAMVQTVTCPAESGNISQGDYFLLDAITSDVTEHFAVWFGTSGESGKPTITGINASNILNAQLSGNTPNSTPTQVATAVASIIDNDGTFGAASSGAIVTITHAASGAVQPARNGEANPDCSFGITTWGSTQYTLSEELTTDLPSFTIHAEQRNTTAGEDIVWDMFGCIVESVEVKVAFSDKLTTYNVTFKCPYALENTDGRNDNPPPRKNLLSFPAMKALQESANNYLLQEENTTTAVHTDRTPKTVDSATLTVTNNVTFQSDVSKQYMAQAFSGQRTITLNIVGATQEKELFTYWQQAYSVRGNDYHPSSANGRLNTVFKLQKDATYDYISIAIRGWLLQEHNFHFVSVDEAVKSVDMTLEDGSSDTNGRIISSFTMISYIDETVMIV